MLKNTTLTCIRRATPADAETIISLIKALADFERLSPPEPAAQERLIRDAFGPKPRFEIFLAEVENKVAGYCFIYETYSTFLAQPTLFLEDIFVLEEYRNRKVGYALFKFCVGEAERRECGRLEWLVLDWNENAQNFYRRQGGKHLQEWYPYRLTRNQFQEALAER